jgi:hypothetical protein
MKKALIPCLACLLLAGRIAAQLPVDQESHHKIVFENNTIRVLEGRVPPGDTTPAHVHAANGVVVFLSQSVFSIQLVGGKPVASSVKPGDLKYVNYGDKPVNHRVWADSGGVFHFFVVELKQHGSVRGNYMDVPKDDRRQLPKSNCDLLLIDISGDVQVVAGGKTCRLGMNGFGVYTGKENIEIRGDGKEKARLIVLLLNI